MCEKTNLKMEDLEKEEKEILSDRSQRLASVQNPRQPPVWMTDDIRLLLP